jgi:bifunctional non-homologous end joining protein LigD
MKIDVHEIEISHPDKVLFPDSGITKSDLVEYYARVAKYMLPHVRGRPITMHRFPDGIEEEGFYQKEAPDYFPEWIERVEVRKKGGEKQYQVVCDSPATLAYIANLGCITPHIWLSRVDHLNIPDKLVFDLDPPDENFEPVREGALLLREAIQKIGLTPYLMTTGSRGLHVVIPLKPEFQFDKVRDFSKSMATVLSEAHTDRLTTEMRKEKRKGRLFLDVFRNAYGQTSVAPYAIRAKEKAPVATPIEWSELDTEFGPKDYRMDNIFRRLGQKEDPWKDFFEKRQSLKSIKL